VAGGDLSAFAQEGKLLPPKTVLEMIFKCCGALDYAYRQGIVHRDLKPANIMLCSGSDVKIVDFGGALLFEHRGTDDVMIGTPYYMSPEQLTGDPLTHLSDMYSLGVLAYELLTGHRPYDDVDINVLTRKVLAGCALPPSRFRAELSPDLDAVVMRLMSADRGKRYADWVDAAYAVADIGCFGERSATLSDSRRFTLLRRLPEFNEFEDPQIWEMVSAGNWRVYAAGTAVMREGEAGQSLFVLISGELKVTRSGRLLDSLHSGEICGEMAYIERCSARMATVETLTESVMVELTFDVLENLSSGCELHFAKLLLRALSGRLALANIRIAQAQT